MNADFPMARLDWFGRLLNLLEQITAFAECLTTPAGIALMAWLLSYQAQLLAGCDAPSAAILASVAALTLHCGLNRPEF